MHSIRILRHYLRPHRRWALPAPLLMALEVVMDLMQPRMLQSIVDVGIARSGTHVILADGLRMVGIAFVGLLGGVGCSICAVLAGQGLGADLPRDTFGKVQSLSFGNLDRLDTGAGTGGHIG
ncbi:MAG: ABC transporter ATP-binding protein [Armatimonadetes bacterium]|nr:ABC transporter ATP-binding protein [Armatimonadota bacterium]